MDTKDLQTFAEVVRHGSFVGAAKALGQDPSVVSRAISGLEARIGVRLFERSTRKISITEAGAAYHARIEPLLAELEDAGAEARDLTASPRGTLRVSASTAFGEAVIVPALPSFRERYSDITLEFLFDDRPVDLIGEKIDLAVRLSPEAPPDMVVSRLMMTRYHVVASPTYLERNPLSQPSDLEDHDCLRFPFDGYRDRWKFRHNETETSVPVSGSIVMAAAMALKKAALAGLGPALLADWMVRDAIQAGDLVDPFPDYRVTATTYDTGAWVIYPSRSYLPLKTRSFIDHLRAAVR